MRAFNKFVRNKAGAGTAPVALGNDADPSATAPAPNADNVCRVPSSSSWSGGLKRLAFVLDGPSDLSYELWIKEESINKWFKAVASTTMTKGAFTFTTNCPAPTNIPFRDADGNMQKDDFVEVYVRLIDPGAAAAGDYTCAIIGDYTN